jgi:hypothetical protein
LGERLRIALAVNQNDHLRRSEAVGPGLHVELELTLHPRATQGDECLVDGLRLGRIGLVRVCGLRVGMDAVIEPGATRIALESVQGSRMTELYGGKIRDGRGNQHAGAFGSGDMFGHTFRKAGSIPELHRCNSDDECG